jgi:predicted ATPase
VARGSAFIRSVALVPERIAQPDAYPFSIPAVKALRQGEPELDAGLTFLVGENGSGKSTLIEAVAVAAGFNPESGSTGFAFSTRASHSPLHEAIRLVRGADRPETGFFLRAESFFNVATEVDELNKESGPPLIEYYGGTSLHERSHGESFLARTASLSAPWPVHPRRARGGPVRHGEPRTAEKDGRAGRGRVTVLVATHSPILMGFPGARILQLRADGFELVANEDTDQYRLTRSFLEAPERFLSGPVRKYPAVLGWADIEPILWPRSSLTFGRFDVSRGLTRRGARCGVRCGRRVGRERGRGRDA